jgi:Family of unknown function (DUF6499)
MPDGSSWRTRPAYDYVERLDVAAFAWEFLRRNPLYRQEYIESADNPVAIAALLRRWGLRFRDGSEPPWRRGGSRLDPRCRSRDFDPHSRESDSCGSL